MPPTGVQARSRELLRQKDEFSSSLLTSPVVASWMPGPGRRIDGIDEGRDVERQRYPSSSVAITGMVRARTAGCRVPAGDQGITRPDPRVALRAGRLL